MARMHHTISFLDSGRDPKCPPDPDYPEGKDVADGLPEPKCMVELPYPAPRCGVYLVTCHRCHLTIGITTAGRPDDPRSVTMSCKRVPQ